MNKYYYIVQTLIEVVENIKNLEISLGYHFKSKKYLLIALSHSSFIEEFKNIYKKLNISEICNILENNLLSEDIQFITDIDNYECNERLEFLGDAVLGLVIADILFKKVKSASEGILSQIRAIIVSRTSLTEIANKLKLNNYILFGKSLENNEVATQKNILASTLEAIFGAIYLDSNYENAYQVIYKLLNVIIERAIQKIWYVKGYNQNIYNYKGLLQQETLKKFKVLPEYVLEKIEGEPHNCLFYVQVKVNNEILGYGVNKTKKGAEQEAAKQALQKLKHIA